MTDSGFSSAASNRSGPSVVRPSLLNKLPSVSASKEASKDAPASVKGGLPKPSPLFHFSGRARFFDRKGNGGYSPSLYSPKEMSPMSSLTFDFRDLNTSREVADTPRKRLSLSSVSSLDSLHLRGHPSPALSMSSTINSPSINQDDGMQSAGGRYGVAADGVVRVRRPLKVNFHPYEQASESRAPTSRDVIVSGRLLYQQEGCFAETPSPVDVTEMETKFDQRILQDKDGNVLANAAAGDPKLRMYRRFKSTPSCSKQSNFRSRLNRNSGKENSPVFPTKKQTFSKFQSSVDSPSPFHPPEASPGSSCHGFSIRRRNSSFMVSPKLTSSPLVTNFTSSSSSAFSSVPHSSLHPSLSKSSSERQEELRKSAEEVLRDAKSPTNVSLTPEKSVVPGSISSLSARTTRLSRPASAAPFCREKLPGASGNVSPVLTRGNKRSLDVTSSSMVTATKRHKRNSTSDSNSTRRRMAFTSKERKAKSEGLMDSSPLTSLKAGFRPISAPALMFSDDDAPLTHSRLCSSNDSDSESVESDDSDDEMMLEHSQQLADEKLVEEILADNNRARIEAGNTTLTGSVIEPPTGIDGLITGPLLASVSEAESRKDVDCSMTERMPKPRELFRSPSAPPLVPRNRSIMKRSSCRCDDGTPQGRRMESFFPTLPEVTCHDVDDEPGGVLNRSRSFNELDIMKAVDLGCSSDNLVGDFSRVCSLPTVDGKCQDLKYITPQTLMNLIDDKEDVGCFEIIDCRYPYEYEGGHIKGATLVWEEEVLYKKFLRDPHPMWASENKGSYKPPVLVFYCEFSSERGPRMARALRSKDRCVNRYPHLHYPEIYILRNGYKNFFYTEGTREYCDPRSYRPMAHHDYAQQLRMCRIKCKTWAGENKGGIFKRSKRF